MKKSHNFAVLAVLLSALLLSGCRKKEEAAEPDLRIPIKMAAVERALMSKAIHTFGRVASTKEMKLSFKTGGIIRKILVDEGQTVSHGRLLAELNLAEIEAQVTQARTAFKKAVRDLERVGNLYKEKAATLEQYQNVQTAHQLAQSQLKAAEFNLQHSKIKAPSRGRILHRLAEENELIGAGMPVFIFASIEDNWIVRVGISDSDLVRVNPGDPASITFDAFPEEEFTAEISQIVESADPYTGTFELELAVAGGKRRLASGFVADVVIRPSQKQDYFIIPIEALVEAEGGRGYIFSVDTGSNSARRIPIEIGFLFEDKVAVKTGLQGISRVVTEGAPYLSEGTEVIIQESPPQTESKRP